LSSRAAISARLKAKVAMPAFPSTRLRARELIVPGVTDFRAALVTGGTGRVGSAIAARLEADGFRVLAAGRRDGDLSTAAGARELVARAAAELGGLDLVVHAASDGFAPRTVEEVTEEDWDAAFGPTAKGSFFVGQAAVPHLRASELGLLVLVEDVAAYQPWPSFAPHCAAKAAQAMLTRVLARALAPDVRVCGVAPGPVAVDPDQVERRAAETVLGRVGTPEDVAGAVAYLVSAPFVTGTSVVVDGGRLLT
jgi:pteridine reductase